MLFVGVVVIGLSSFVKTLYVSRFKDFLYMIFAGGEGFFPMLCFWCLPLLLLIEWIMTGKYIILPWRRSLAKQLATLELTKHMVNDDHSSKS